jgi:hypothetical protein
LTPDGGDYQKFSINLDDIEGRRIGDIILRPGDIVEIRNATGKSAQRPYFAFWQQKLRGTQTIAPPTAAKRF